MLLVALAAASGCDSEGRTRPPPTTVRFMHASPQFGELKLFRELRPLAETEFGGGSTVRIDSGPYDFSLQSLPPPGTLTLLHATLTEDLSAGMQYTFVAAAPNGEPELLVSAVANLPAGFTNARYTIIHGHPAQAAMDVYVVPPGTPLTSVAPQGSISYGPTAATLQVTPQTLRIYLTPAGDPATVLYESVDLFVEAGSDNFLVIHETGGQTEVNFGVTQILGNSALRISRQGDGAQIRVVQGIDDRLDRDIILDDATTTPLFSALPFGEISDYAPVSAGQHTLKLTPVGAPGTEEETLDFTPIPGRYYLDIFAGDTTDGVSGVALLEDPRRIVNQASLYVVDAAGMFNGLVVFILAPGSDIFSNFASAVLTPPGYSGRLAFAPGDYEITVMDQVTFAIVAGPLPVTLADEGLYGVLLLNAADNVTVDFEYFYDPLQ